MDWLLSRQEEIEKSLAAIHLVEGTLVLYDVSSTYFEAYRRAMARLYPLAKFGYNRDKKKGKLQIVFGLLCNAQGCPEAQLLKKLNLTTLGDLLHYYPRKHLHFQRTRIRAVQAGETVTLVGKVASHHICNTRRPGLTLQKWLIRDRDGSIACTQFYHHPFYQSYQWRREQQRNQPPTKS
jgi:hypothetical protein